MRRRLSPYRGFVRADGPPKRRGATRTRPAAAGRHGGALCRAAPHRIPVRLPPKTGGTMPLQRLEHYLVLSDDIHKTRDFYRDVLGMAEGFRPELEFPGFWLYLGDTPCIHIAEWQSYAAWTKKSAFRSRRARRRRAPSITSRSTAPASTRCARGSSQRGLTFSENSLDDIGLKQCSYAIRTACRSRSISEANGDGNEDHGLRIHRRRPHGRAHGAAPAQGGHQPHGVRHVEGRAQPSSRRTARKSRARRSTLRTTPKSRS